MNQDRYVPKWAKDTIEQQAAEIRRLQSIIETLTGEVTDPVFFRRSGTSWIAGRDGDVPLGDRNMYLRIKMHRTEWDDSLDITIQPPGDGLNLLSTHGRIVVRPLVSNHININIE